MMKMIVGIASRALALTHKTTAAQKVLMGPIKSDVLEAVVYWLTIAQSNTANNVLENPRMTLNIC